MKAKVWRASDPYRVPVWHGELEEKGPGEYQMPEGFLSANEQYFWCMYEGELPEHAQTLPPDEVPDMEMEFEHVHKFVLRTWQFGALVALACYLFGMGIAYTLILLERWVF